MCNPVDEWFLEAAFMPLGEVGHKEGAAPKTSLVWLKIAAAFTSKILIFSINLRFYKKTYKSATQTRHKLEIEGISLQVRVVPHLCHTFIVSSPFEE